MKVKLLAFGIAGEIIGANSQSIELPDGSDIRALQDLLSDKYPALSTILEYALAVNRSYIEENILLKEDDEVAIIPPVSGG